MIDLNGIIDVFIITNGRSTFPYCMKSVEEQKGINFNLRVHENMDWLSAHEKILKDCGSNFFLRVDDDMMLNPYALKFMYNCVSGLSSKVSLRGWRLWEPWSNKRCKGIKVYNLKNAKKIGFRIDHLGKIDKPFTKDSKNLGFKVVYTDDLLAIHACSTISEHLEYWSMRGEATGDNFKSKEKWLRKHMGNFKMTLEQQYELRRGFLRKLNKKYKTNFYNHMGRL
ncbi:MAG: hypothetical protein ACTSSP_03595 [Candidatus Asgardarchaeia archaeon]